MSDAVSRFRRETAEGLARSGDLPSGSSLTVGNVDALLRAKGYCAHIRDGADQNFARRPGGRGPVCMLLAAHLSKRHEGFLYEVGERGAEVSWEAELTDEEARALMLVVGYDPVARIERAWVDPVERARAVDPMRYFTDGEKAAVAAFDGTHAHSMGEVPDV